MLKWKKKGHDLESEHNGAALKITKEGGRFVGYCNGHKCMSASECDSVKDYFGRSFFPAEYVTKKPRKKAHVPTCAECGEELVKGKCPCCGGGG